MPSHASTPPQPPPESLLEEAKRHHREGNLEKAEALYDAMLSTDPNNVDILYFVSRVCAKGGNFSRVIKHLDLALSLLPNHPVLIYDLACALFGLERMEEALERYREVIRLKPDHAYAYYYVGFILMHQDKQDDATQALETAVHFSPGHVQIHRQLATAYRAQGKTILADYYGDNIYFLDRNRPLQEARQVADFLETVLQKDADEQHAEVSALARNTPLSPEKMVYIIYSLLGRFQLRPAFTLAVVLDEAGHKDVILSLALGFGSLLYDTSGGGARWVTELTHRMDALTLKQRSEIHFAFLFQLVERFSKHTLQAGAHGLEHADLDLLLRLMEVCRAAIPPFRPLFDFKSSIPELSQEVLRQQGWAKANLLAHPLPPADLPRRKVRAVLFMKDFYISRRIVAGMNDYGWDAKFYGKEGWGAFDLPSDFQIALELCQQHDAELLVLYLDQMLQQVDLYSKLVIQLRKEKPSLNVVALTCDGWYFRSDVLEGQPSQPLRFTTLTDLVDGIWTSDFPSLSLWRDPLLIDKMFHSHIPHAGNRGTTERALIPKMLFIGELHSNIISARTFWLAAARHMNLPLEHKQHSYATDGLSILGSYAQHMKRLEEATCCINFTRKSNLACVVSHRSFEVPLSGGLLIQEATPDMNQFFVSGEHYLEFSSVSELSAIARFITEKPEEAEEIRRRGHAFAKEHYSDERLIGYLDAFLFHQKPSSGTEPSGTAG